MHANFRHCYVHMESGCQSLSYHPYYCNGIFQKSSLPHAMRMNLPNTGLKYSLDSVCLFAKGPSLSI